MTDYTERRWQDVRARAGFLRDHWPGPFPSSYVRRLLEAIAEEPGEPEPKAARGERRREAVGKIILALSCKETASSHEDLRAKQAMRIVEELGL